MENPVEDREQLFALDRRLASDGVVIGDFPLSCALLMNDRRYPWVILVPRIAHVEELYQLSEADQVQLTKELSFVASELSELFSADKVNIAALGNIVRQLHVHVVVRFQDDPAWPGPVWGYGEREPYLDIALSKMRERLALAFAEQLEK